MQSMVLAHTMQSTACLHHEYIMDYVFIGRYAIWSLDRPDMCERSLNSSQLLLVCALQGTVLRCHACQKGVLFLQNASHIASSW